MENKLQEAMIKALDILIFANELQDVRNKKENAVSFRNYEEAAKLRDIEVQMMNNAPTLEDLKEIRSSLTSTENA